MWRYNPDVRARIVAALLGVASTYAAILPETLGEFAGKPVLSRIHSRQGSLCRQSEPIAPPLPVSTEGRKPRLMCVHTVEAPFARPTSAPDNECPGRNVVP